MGIIRKSKEFLLGISSGPWSERRVEALLDLGVGTYVWMHVMSFRREREGCAGLTSICRIDMRDDLPEFPRATVFVS